jgi:hypothetical protein
MGGVDLLTEFSNNEKIVIAVGRRHSCRCGDLGGFVNAFHDSN